MKEVGLVDDIMFVHPKDMQDGKVDITSNDITTNLPFVPGVHLCVDHHVSETLRTPERADNCIIDPDAPSVARVVYDYYGDSARFPAAWTDMVAAVDKADAAQFTAHEIFQRLELEHERRAQVLPVAAVMVDVPVIPPAAPLASR